MDARLEAGARTLAGQEQEGGVLAERWVRVRTRLRSEVGEAAFKSWLKPLVLMGLRDASVRLGVPSRFMRDWVIGNYAERLRHLWSEEAPDVRGVEIVVLPPHCAAPRGAQERTAATAGATAADGAQQGPTVNAASAPQAAVAPPGAVQPEPGQAHRSRSSYHQPDYPQAAYYQPGYHQAARAQGGADEAGRAALDARALEISAPLDPRFTFDNFVVGKPNELAYAAARRVAEAETAPFNPLFLYGSVGLGKTHLMHAIAWHLRTHCPKKRVIYLSAEKFMYQFVRALRTKDTMAFKEQFRTVDVLMIDDVQFISGREATQEEFFHTFNALVDHNRQVVISADKSPSDLEGVDERMRSRFGWGLVADIHPTTYELRLGILQAKAEQVGVPVPLKVIEFLAHKITSNVRELEGALNRIVAHATLVGRSVTLETTQEVLHDLLRASDRRVTIEEIQKRVAEHFNMRLADMTSARRARAVARPRQVAMYLAKQLTSRSLPEIGRKFGGRDHTTVMHAVRKVDELKASDPSFAEDVELLRRMLEA